MVKKSKGRPSQEKSLSAFIPSAISCIVSLLVLTCICAAVLCRTDIPHSALGWIMTGVCAASCFIGGMVQSSVTGEKGLAGGAIIGLVMFVFLWAVGMIGGQIEFSLYAVIRMLIFVVAGAIGGYLGILRHEKKRRRRPA